MMLVLPTWLWTTAASALILVILITVQRLLVGPAAGGRRQRAVALWGISEPVTRDSRERDAQAA